jgi:hypothetical protein
VRIADGRAALCRAGVSGGAEPQRGGLTCGARLGAEERTEAADTGAEVDPTVSRVRGPCVEEAVQLHAARLEVETAEAQKAVEYVRLVEAWGVRPPARAGNFRRRRPVHSSRRGRTGGQARGRGRRAADVGGAGGRRVPEPGAAVFCRYFTIEKVYYVKFYHTKLAKNIE